MKTKYFLRGFGVGVILASAVMFGVYSYQMNDVNVVRRAKELGMVYQSPEKEEESGSANNKKEEAEESSSVSQEKQEGTTENRTTSQQQTSSQQMTTPSQETTTIRQNHTQENTTVTPSGIYGGDGIKVNIYQGMTGTAFARMLKEVGIIEDSDAFISYLKESGYNTHLRMGDFILYPGMSFEEITNVVGAEWVRN